MTNRELKPGEIVYVMYRNPHVQNVANIQEAVVAEHPDQTGQLCLFLYDTFYPITDDLAVFRSKNEAEQAYEYYFGTFEQGEL